MKSKYIKVLTVVLAIALVGAIAVSQTMHRSHMHEGDMFGGHMLGFFADYLNLTDAQQAQVKEIMAKEKPTIRPLMEQMHQIKRQLRDLEMSGSFNESRVRELAT